MDTAVRRLAAADARGMPRKALRFISQKIESYYERAVREIHVWTRGADHGKIRTSHAAFAAREVTARALLLVKQLCSTLGAARAGRADISHNPPHLIRREEHARHGRSRNAAVEEYARGQFGRLAARAGEALTFRAMRTEDLRSGGYIRKGMRASLPRSIEGVCRIPPPRRVHGPSCRAAGRSGPLTPAVPCSINSSIREMTSAHFPPGQDWIRDTPRGTSTDGGRPAAPCAPLPCRRRCVPSPDRSESSARVCRRCPLE